MNQTASIDWISASVILGVGLAIGLFMIYRIKVASKGGTLRAPEEVELERRDLEAKRDVLIEHLRELDDADAKGSPESLATERFEAELEAADVLRRLDALEATLAPTPLSLPLPAQEVEGEHDEAQGVLVHRPGLRGFLWGAGSVSVLAFLGFFVMQAMTQREPDGLATGGTGMAPAGVVAAGDAEVVNLEQAVARSPEDLNLRLELAQAYLVRENLMSVFDQTQFVLQRDPENPRGLTYQAFVRIAMGQYDLAEEMLKVATQKDPDFLDGWVQLSLLYTLSGRSAEAESAIEEAARRRPDHADALRTLLAEIRANRQEPVEAGTPPVAAAPATPALSTDPKSVAGTIALSGSRSGGGILFITARPEGVVGGPPVAVVRIEAAAFPVAFQLTSAHSMMGQPLPERLRIDVRLDADGDAMTRDPSEPKAAVDSVTLGDQNLRITLQ
ncbi:MAG TPA: tetratricopeptide repeat protein [Thermoanaerobaculia bacterium]|nr:tetratricopeptide repeat protein [Thermoanaerobaculia bacterium]